MGTDFYSYLKIRRTNTSSVHSNTYISIQISKSMKSSLYTTDQSTAAMHSIIIIVSMHLISHHSTHPHSHSSIHLSNRPNTDFIHLAILPSILPSNHMPIHTTIRRLCRPTSVGLYAFPDCKMTNRLTACAGLQPLLCKELSDRSMLD